MSHKIQLKHLCKAKLYNFKHPLTKTLEKCIGNLASFLFFVSLQSLLEMLLSFLLTHPVMHEILYDMETVWFSLAYCCYS